MGNMTTMYPELFRAVVCQVPLLDMQRYHKLLAGASWMGEYGDPEKPEEWAWLQRYSPYHNLQKATKYPKVLLTTSTRDDRVHPGQLQADRRRGAGALDGELNGGDTAGTRSDGGSATC